jgi:immune inhibitor A
VNRNRWLGLAAILVALVLCCCLVLWGLALLLWLGVQPAAVIPAQQAGGATLASPPQLVYRSVTSAERATAYTVAQATLPTRDLLSLGQRFQGLPTGTSRLAVEPAPAYTLGDHHTFWIHDIQTNSYFATEAVLRYQTAHANWWVEAGQEVDAADLERSALRFENQTYPTNRRYFGSEWIPGVDGDSRVSIFLGRVPGVGGYFSGSDSYPATLRPWSNQREMFYINLDNAAPGNDYFDGILAHEFQHMIHWALDRDEDTWVNEGLSELAAQVNGYDVGASAQAFALQPDTQLNAWTELDYAGPHYGASYLFFSYILERYGPGAIRQLAAEPANGIAGIEAVLFPAPIEGPGGILAGPLSPGAPRAVGGFVDLFADWTIANYLDDAQWGDGRYGYVELQLEPLAYAALHDRYPLHEQATVQQFATDYIRLQGKGPLTIEFSGSQAVSLVGNQVRTGTYQWWSHRGDDADVTLTRAFDLSGLQTATLQVWMWYSLESDYDYAYVSTSVDGGETWQILANDHTTDYNPSGNSYGPAFTGKSGGGEAPEWVLESFDLTPYAGQRIQLRFEVVTDEALNEPGVCLDGIEIPELGYAYDADDGPGGWQAAGWLRVTDQIPQKFLVQVITLGRETRVERLRLDGSMRGTFTLQGLGDDVDYAVLAVSAITPVTTEPAAYEYRITTD